MTASSDAGRDQHELADRLDDRARFWRQQRHERVHADLPARPSDQPAIEKHAGDHQEEHHLLGPLDRDREEVPADDVGEVDHDAADQHDAGDDADDAHHGVRPALERLVMGIFQVQRLRSPP
jgi:hypothetical protein